jgi:hypothetical protein
VSDTYCVVLLVFFFPSSCVPYVASYVFYSIVCRYLSHIVTVDNALDLLSGRYLCLFMHSGIRHILCCAFGFFSPLHLVYHMLAVSLDCTFLIAPSVFSNVYLMYALYFRFDSLVCLPFLVH